MLFALAPCLLLIFYAWRRKKRRRKAWHFAVSDDRLYLPASAWKRIADIIPFWCISLTLVLLITAFARPLGSYKEQILTDWSREIMNTMDVSTSTTGEGIASIKKALANFIKRRMRHIQGGERHGLTIYSTSATVIVLPTEDSNLLESEIKSLNAGGLTAIGDGLFVSIFALISREAKKTSGFDRRKLYDLLKREALSDARIMIHGLGPFKNKVINLFTDGLNNTGLNPLASLWLAKELGIKVYFISIPPSSVTGLSREGARKTKAAIRHAVEKTGGKYFDGTSFGDAERFYNEIDQLEYGKVVLGTVSRRQDYFPYVIYFMIFLVGCAVIVRVFIPTAF